MDSHSQLAAVLDRDVASVNSLHHQAVDRVGAGLRAVARSEDGFVEALEIADYGFGIAVQWHPEHMPQDKTQQNLIAAFGTKLHHIETKNNSLGNIRYRGICPRSFTIELYF